MGWSYGWNGENRLISAENGDTRLEFSYDYMGRRFEKKVYTANVLTKHEKFVYDGYKLIQVLDALNSDAVTMAFAWHPESTGLDTPFSMTYDGETYYYVTDGSKNVMSLIDAAGTKVAEYVYDPFGRLLSSTGELAEINPFRFSSEYHDDETGLVYYNYRYYSPELGRWISRDPIEEEGGVRNSWLTFVKKRSFISSTSCCFLTIAFSFSCSIFFCWIRRINHMIPYANNKPIIMYKAIAHPVAQKGGKIVISRLVISLLQTPSLFRAFT